MAVLTKGNSLPIRDSLQISEVLEREGIRFDHWPLPLNLRLEALLKSPNLFDFEEAELISMLHTDLSRHIGQVAVENLEVISLISSNSVQDEVIHFHHSDETKYLLNGNACVHLIAEDGAPFELTLEAGDFMQIPSGTEHSLHACSTRPVFILSSKSGQNFWSENLALLNQLSAISTFSTHSPGDLTRHYLLAA